ncbi:MAG TPA: T9SS type A sorting domain-containing protein [Chitinophagales bacterium]|mgnify:CR=1 FL=1|nr:T9SS type A sorting domain-containing protein [Chitinophagales bacterium]HRP40455.1 T9SS type A sorting domain-containing protein [Chitinophagales bacterium]
MKTILSILLSILIFESTAQTPGNLDLTFDPGTGTNNIVASTAIQSDGKIIIGGNFSSYNGTTIRYLARMYSDGTLDTTLNGGTGANMNIIGVALQTDGKIIIVGNFTTYNGVSANRVARLNANGTLDGTFTIGTGASGQNVQAVAIQSDGKIIITGEFSTYNGTSRNNIARLNTNGTLDGTFTVGTGANLPVRTAAIQSNGKIIIGGDFTSYNGTTINRIARLNSDGTLDGTFNIGAGANASVLTTSIQGDGKIVVGGNFTSINGTTRNYITRLNTNGALDGSFSIGTGADNPVNTTTIQIDGKIIIGGSFTSYNGTARSRIARLDTLGALDGIFTVGTGATGNPTTKIYTTALQSDGKVVIGGNFSGYNGTLRINLARLNGGNCIPPSVSITTSGATTFCQGDSVTLTANSVGSYQWNTGDTSASITATLSNTYSVTATENFCSASASQTVTVNPNPPVTFSLPSFINNHASPITLNGSPTGGTYTTVAGLTGTTFNPSQSSLGSKQITYSFTNGSNCSSAATTTTVVYDTTGIVCSDTTHLSVYDTTHIVVNDTIRVTINDTTYISISTTDTLVIDVTLTGIVPPSNINIVSVYPNPAHDHLVIDNGDFNSMTGYSIKITNALGQIVFNQTVTQQVFNIDLNTFGGNGTYIVYVLDALQTVKNTKLIVLQ